MTEGHYKEQQYTDQLKELMLQLCTLSTNAVSLDPALIEQVSNVLGHSPKVGEDIPQGAPSDAQLKLLRGLFDSCDKQLKAEEEHRQFEMIEEYVRNEQILGKERRARTRELSASEEKRLALDIAALRKYEVGRRQQVDYEGEIHRETARVERAYMNRKAVLSKAALQASADCRLQFARVRSFIESLHQKKLAELEREFKSGWFFMELSHALEGKDKRVCSLEKQIANRVYQKKKADANEYHMAQNLEEAQYLEKILIILDEVQEGKETAAREIMELELSHLREAAATARERSEELELFYASAKLEMAKVVASNLEMDEEDGEEELWKAQLVNRVERQKGFAADGSVQSISDLYDEILWSVATNNLSLSSSKGRSCMDDSTLEEEGDKYGFSGDFPEPEETEAQSTGLNNDNGTDSGLGEEETAGQCSPIGHLHIRQLTRTIHAGEKEIIERHKKFFRGERRLHREAMRHLKEKHNRLINALVENSEKQRYELREGVKNRMAELARSQKDCTDALLANDTKLMHEALQEEDKRLFDAKESSFVDAQELISAQVFHEVRNALSSVVAMSEIADCLKKDSTVSADMRISSIDEMVDQNTEIVAYALQTLNNVLDLSKLKTSSMDLDICDFDLQDLVSRCTIMQKAKARKAPMSFKRDKSREFIAKSDPDITTRIMTNLISNAVKFTDTGGIQPFVWPLELVEPNYSNSDLCTDREPGSGTKMNMVAVGVADTGSGLDQRKLDSAQTGLLNARSGTHKYGASNSGFGLHLCQILARSLGTKLYLSRLENVPELLSQSIKDALDEHQACANQKNGKCGTVLYFVLPVYEDSGQSQKVLRQKRALQPVIPSTVCPKSESLSYVFRPRPSPTGGQAYFRILIADDVAMLRKGLANAIISIFKNCAVSISTACTAEDLLRAAASSPYDLIISDNLFRLDSSMVQKMSFKEEKRNGRPFFCFDPQSSAHVNIRSKMSDFFKEERFTIREGDGEMLGIDALIELSKSNHGNFPTPILVILSGHKIEVLDELGIIVAQKPLRQADLAALLERNAARLLETDFCSEMSSSDEGSNPGSSQSEDESTFSSQSISLVNRLGAQIFELESVSSSEAA